jgi:hypothetical protein
MKNIIIIALMIGSLFSCSIPSKEIPIEFNGIAMGSTKQREYDNTFFGGIEGHINTAENTDGKVYLIIFSSNEKVNPEKHNEFIQYVVNHYGLQNNEKNDKKNYYSIIKDSVQFRLFKPEAGFLILDRKLEPYKAKY